MPDVLPYTVIWAIEAVVSFVETYGAYIAAASAVYQNVAASEAQRRARNQARDAYNAGLTDRTVSYSSADSPWRIPYGEVVTGGLVAAQLTYGDRDQYQAVVIIWADCECDAITDVQLNGESLGTLDSEGRVTGGRWAKENTGTESDNITFDGSGNATLTRPAAQLVSISYTVQVLHDNGQSGDAQQTWWADEDVVVPVASLSISGQVVTWAGAAGKAARANYNSNTVTPYVRVRHHLGTMDQEPDAYLRSVVPSTQWGPNDRLAGKCYSVFEFCLDHAELQGGPPKMTVRLRGKKVFDHRTGTTAWSPNAALCALDYLRGEHGKAQPDHTINWASWDAAANVCDEALASQSGAKRYRCDGVVTTSNDSDQTLQQLCQAMAGSAVYAGVWYGMAGAYTAPAMDLGPADNAGSVEVVSTPQGLEVFNGLRGQFYDRDRYDQLTDYTPYQNTAFVATDGEAWWGPLNLPFTSENWRAHNLARIEVERSRGMTVMFPAKRRAIKLRPGQRVRLTVPQLGLNLAVFRVVKKEYRPGAAVALTLVQDDPSFWDEADAPAPLESPAAGTLDPFTVAAPLNFAATSSEAVAVRDADGSVISRARATWEPSGDGLVQRGGAMQIEVRLADSDTWVRMPEIGPSATQADLQGLQDKRLYAVRARWRNSWGQVSDWRASYVQTNVPVVALAGGGVASLEVQYSVDGSTSWHGTFTSGDLFMRQRVGAGAWSSAIRIVAENSGNLIDATWWRPGAAWEWQLLSEGPDTNEIVFATGPLGATQPLWRAVSGDGEDGADAGWQEGSMGTTPKNAFRPDVTKTYRFEVLIFRQSGYGYTYFGVTPSGQAVCDLNTASPADNPYFAYSNSVPVGVWLRCVGYVYPAGSVGATHSGAGIFNLLTGEQVTAGLNFTWKAGATECGTRAFLYYSSTGTAQLFSPPVVKIVDGTEGSHLPGPAGAAGASVEVQYSIDASSWHGSFTINDLYMRQRVGTGAWSAAIRIVGEQGNPGSTGNYIDVVFKRSATQPATPTGDGTPAGWSDAPPADDGNPLWMSSGEKVSATNTLVGTWSSPVRLTGERGPQGDTGPRGLAGDQGATLYTWIAYANSADGSSGFTTGASSGHAYIGLANNKTSATESTNPADYTWSLIKGDQGVPGTPGTNGAPTYTWFAYANTPDGSSGFTTGGWSGQSYLGIAANKATSTESANPADYTWSLIQGAPGANNVLYTVTFADAAGLTYSNMG